MRLEYEYGFEIEFNPPVKEHAYAIIAKPHPSSYKIVNYKSNLDADSYYDGFGNEVLFGNIKESHGIFSFKSQGTVETSSRQAPETLPVEIFLMPSKLTPFCEELKEYKNMLDIEHKSPIEQALFVNSFIFSNFEYKRGVTNADSDIKELLSHKSGVCQDFAHLFCTLLRLKGVPCRYVSGLLEGEGESHAWAEAFLDGRWTGFDPTHDTTTDGGAYIKFAHGRDYADCPPNRGVFCGISEQLITVSSILRHEQ